MIKSLHSGMWITALGAVLLATGCGSPPAPGNAAGNSPAAPKAPATSGSLATDAKAAANVQAAVPRAVFHTGPQAGRDPFFPNSTRGMAKATPESAPVPQVPLVSHIKLFGIRPGTDRPMALINRTPFAPGEEGDVTVVIGSESNRPEIQKVNIRCLEIRRDSVLISIAGEVGVKELRMAQAK